jgi:ATP-binding cassette subfamily B multidrug efflux pump
VVSRSAASGKRIAEVLREEEEFDEVQMHGDEVISDGSLSFEDVSFRYHKDSHRNILEDISFRIHSGGTLGIIGRTGSGKSTLVQLIPRLYEVDTGTIRVGGKDIRSVSPVALRDAVSMVLQKNTLFSGTIRENLQWGNEKADDATLMRAAEMAGAAEFIQRFSEGLDTMLEQDGRNLSGGQRQRLTIARALLTEPKILILDDSTSAVDMATERDIQEALEKSLPGMTKIIIAQRISSVQNADKILVIEEGKIAGEGTHEELIKTCDIYESIYRSQTWKEGANVS